jgi:hypothetical protein
MKRTNDPLALLLSATANQKNLKSNLNPNAHVFVPNKRSKNESDAAVVLPSDAISLPTAVSLPTADAVSLPTADAVSLPTAVSLPAANNNDSEHLGYYDNGFGVQSDSESEDGFNSNDSYDSNDSNDSYDSDDSDDSETNQRKKIKYVFSDHGTFYIESDPDCFIQFDFKYGSLTIELFICEESDGKKLLYNLITRLKEKNENAAFPVKLIAASLSQDKLIPKGKTMDDMIREGKAIEIDGIKKLTEEYKIERIQALKAYYKDIIGLKEGLNNEFTGSSDTIEAATQDHFGGSKKKTKKTKRRQTKKTKKRRQTKKTKKRRQKKTKRKQKGNKRRQTKKRGKR